MSDTDDGFDEEAVREELREKYEDDDRGDTERMSELLLQGATMTNQHCDRCGNPIFRYEGESFCPNCQQAAEGGQAGQQNAGRQRRDGQQPATQQAGGQAQPTDARTNDQQVRNEGEASQQADAANSAAAGGTDRRQQPLQGDEASARDQRSPDVQPPSGGQSPSGGASAGEGAAALESSIAALARRAAGADDPRRAREFLEAAREAAEALDALRRNA